MKSLSFEIKDDIYENISAFIFAEIKYKKSSHIKNLESMSREVLKSLLAHRHEDEKFVTVNVRQTFTNIYITLSCKGSKYDTYVSDNDSGTKNIIIEGLSKPVEYNYSEDTNSITVIQQKYEYSEVLFTLSAMVLGILFGFLVRNFASESVSDTLQSVFLIPFRTVFINALKMFISPIVFFSMVCCISQFKNISEIGRIAIRVLGLYILTTVIAVLLGFTLFNLFPVGDSSIINSISAETDILEAEEVVLNENFSFSDIIVHIVADNIITPFSKGNLLQILFLAIFCGIGVSIVSSHYPVVRNFFMGMNEMFLTMMKLLCKFIPVAVFCNMVCLVIDTGFEVLISIFGFAVLAVSGIVCMMLIYNVLILLLARLNPVPFIKTYARTMLTAFTLSSTTAAMPVSIETCKKMGISNKIVSFAIPLGSAINMDGSSLVMSIACLFMARIYGIEMTPLLLCSILFSILLLSLGAPSMAGADLAIISILIAQIGVPASAIALIMGIDTVLDMCQSMSNTTGDAAVALIVAKQENLLDIKKYNQEC